ncbi:hypothetical protein OAT16_09645 [Prolixibacteraceae bacterium]|nr:hypothetical protein [Prolixibacteraceae bacterium]
MNGKHLLVGVLLFTGIFSCNSKKEAPKMVNIGILTQKVAAFAGNNHTAKKDRRFRFDSVDLNDDGKKEVLVGIPNMYFCGSGGCTFFLLDDRLEVIQKFTVSDVPFKVLKTKHNGWHDLVIKSGRKSHFMLHNGDHYPVNPSISPLWDENGEVLEIIFETYYKGMKTYNY